MGTDRRAVGRWAGASLGTEARLSLAELSGGSGRFPHGASRVRRRRRAGNEAAVGGGGRWPAAGEQRVGGGSCGAGSAVSRRPGGTAGVLGSGESRPSVRRHRASQSARGAEALKWENKVLDPRFRRR